MGLHMKIKKPKFWNQDTKDALTAAIPAFLVLVVVAGVAYKYVDPAVPKHFRISTGDNDSNYFAYAKEYKEMLKQLGGVDLDVQTSKGAWENLHRLENKETEVGFVQDGLGD